MKIRAYLRVAKNGYKYKIEAGTKENSDPIYLPGTYRKPKEALPTVAFAVDFEIPDQLFSRASIVVAAINIATKDATILGEVPVPGKKK